ASASDVHGVAGVAEEADDPIVPEYRCHHRDVVELTGRLPRVVGHQDVAWTKCVRRKCCQEVMHGGSQRVDVTGRPGHRLSQHASVCVEHGGREVARLPYDRRERRSLEGGGLFVRHGDQTSPQDLEGDRIEPGFHPTSTTRLPEPSTFPLPPGPMTTVDACSSTTHGPTTSLPGPSLYRSSTATSTRPVSWNQALRDRFRAAPRSAAAVTSTRGSGPRTRTRHVITSASTPGGRRPYSRT